MSAPPASISSNWPSTSARCSRDSVTNSANNSGSSIDMRNSPSLIRVRLLRPLLGRLGRLTPWRLDRGLARLRGPLGRWLSAELEVSGRRALFLFGGRFFVYRAGAHHLDVVVLQLAHHHGIGQDVGLNKHFGERYAV